jgi:hypothetical protein
MESEALQDEPYAAQDDSPDEQDDVEARRDAEARAQAERDSPRPGGGLRLLAAAVMTPWLFGYGISGAWAVTRGARAAAGGLSSIDVGYAHTVTPAGVIFVGALLLSGFAVLLAAAMLLIYDARGGGVWAAVGVAAAVLTAGSVWAAASGGLRPVLWLLFFGGLLYAAALSAVKLLRVRHAADRGRIAGP